MARLSLDVRYDSVIFLEFLSMARQRGSECALCALPVPVPLPESAAKAVGQVFRHRVLYLLATSHLTIMGGGMLYLWRCHHRYGLGNHSDCNYRYATYSVASDGGWFLLCYRSIYLINQKLNLTRVSVPGIVATGERGCYW